MKKILIIALVAIIAIMNLRLAFAQAVEVQRRVTLNVPTMTCPICPITVKESLEKLPGVIQVKIDLKRKTATVLYDPQKVKINQLILAATNAGYPAKIK
ncbi:MAG: cation transporter [Candidatus Berkiella sp.]